MVPHERNWREFAPEQPHPDIPYQCASVPFAARGHHWQGPGCENGKRVYPIRGWWLRLYRRRGSVATHKNCRVHLSYSWLSLVDLTHPSPDYTDLRALLTTQPSKVPSYLESPE